MNCIGIIPSKRSNSDYIIYERNVVLKSDLHSTAQNPFKVEQKGGIALIPFSECP